ncbi:uncharacterized protein LOC129564781 [Sitodiplosis mosellana]|uniref:uncharacterized protein LOC129564781 n=1 Tax=Sitodiplosis mosellana TaxID=263140 RepID=UPI002443FE84|nr:uncharacterized protein LOC129564781 [Sitodiplosis mosellana]
MLSDWLKMKLLIGLVAISVCSVSATPTPQIFGGFQPPILGPFGNWLQNSIQNIPRPPFFQNGISWNPFRPQTQPVQVAPAPQQVIPAQAHAQWPQAVEVPIRQINNNGWYWQNWIPLPIIPQYGPDQSPTIIIISRPAKPEVAETSNANATATATATANSSSNQSTNISLVLPNSNESSTNSSVPVPVPVSNSSEPTQSALSLSAAVDQSSSNVGSSTSASTTEANTSTIPPENITNVPDLGLTILNPVVPLAPYEPITATTNASLPETTAQ